MLELKVYGSDSVFRGLEFLKARSWHWPAKVLEVLPFFEIVGPTLLILETEYGLLPPQVCDCLTVLQELTLWNLSFEPDLYLSFLPPTIKRLTISAPNYLPETTSWDHLSLEVLEFVAVKESIDFSSLPLLKLLIIRRCSVENLITSLEELSNETVPFLELRLGKVMILVRDEQEIPPWEELTENQVILDRCQELGIHWTRLDDGEY